MDKLTIEKNKQKNPVNNPNNNNINILPSDNTSEEDVIISPIKLMNTLSSTKQGIIAPLCKLEKFLPPLNILNSNKKTLVLDLDETLIHSYFDRPPPRSPDISFDIFIDKKKIHVDTIIRPGVNQFLENLEKFYEIIIFTASLSQYANPVLDFIDKKGSCKFRLYREHCCCCINEFGNNFIKDLKKLNRDLKNLIIIDNNPKSFILNKENGIPIKTWIEDLNDKELYKLEPYLIFLGNNKIDDVRFFLKNINSGNSLDYDKFDILIKEYNTQKEKELEIELNKINNTNDNINNEINMNIKNINQKIYDSININNNKENKENKIPKENNTDKIKEKEKEKNNIIKKKEKMKNNLNIPKRNEKTNKELILFNKRNNNSMNNLNNNKKENNINNTNNIKQSLEEEDLLIDEYNNLDDKIKNIIEINQLMKKKNNNFINNTTREAISININKINNNKNDFFLKANSNINIYKNNQIRNDIKFKSIQFSEQEKTIINDEIEYNEKSLFDDIDIENNEKQKNEKELNNNDNKEYSEYDNITLNMKKKKRKINKNLFNKGKNNKYKINPEKKLVLKNDLFSKNDKCDYLSKKIFTKNIFSSLNKKEQNKNNNNISSYKIFKEKTKHNLFIKNKSTIIKNNEMDLALFKRNSNLIELQNKLIGIKTNMNIDKNNIHKNIFKNLKKRPTSCVNKKYEGIINNNNKIDINKKIIRFTKQDKKIYLKTKKTKINLDNINNNISKNENEESKEDIKDKKDNIITDIFFVKNLKEKDNKIMFNNVSDFKDNNYDDNKKDFIQLYNKAILL